MRLISIKSRFSVLAIVLSLLITLSLGTAEVFAAAGGTGPGGRKATTDYRHSAKAGATWAYYKYNGGTGPVTIAGWNHGNTTQVNEACREYGGFYALVFLEYDAANSSGDSIDYTGRTGGVVRLGRISGMGGGNVRYVQRSVSDTAGDAVIVSSGEPLASIQQKFNSMPAEAKWGYTWGTNSALNWFCYGDGEVAEGMVYSTSAVTFDQGPATQVSDLDGKVTMSVSRNASISSYTVHFTHRIVLAERPSSGFNGLAIDWQIRGNGGGTTGSLSPVSDGGWTQRPDGKWEIVVNTSASMGLSGRMCQQIWYKPKHVKLEGGVRIGQETGYSYYSEACATINNVPPPNPDCSGLTASTGGLPYEASTLGASRVQNMNVSTTTGWAENVYARPGDTIRFKHCFSFPVQGVRSSSSDGVSEVYITGTPSQKPANTLKNSFIITASPSNAYLLGLRKDQGSLGNTITLAKHTSSPTRDGGGSIQVDRSGNYWLELVSPTTQAVDQTRYNCLANDFIVGFVNNGYHIPGYKVLSNGNCNAATEGRSNYDRVGSTIKQSIKYPEIHGWVTWRHSDSGSCTCSNNGYWPYNSRNIWNYGANGWSGRYRSSYWGKSYYTGWNLCDANTCGEGKKGSATDSKPCSSRTYSSYCTCTQTDHAAVPAAGTTPAVAAWSESDISCSGYKDKSHSFAYPTNFENGGERTSTATAWIPYSYTTNVTSSIQEGDAVFSGGSVSSFFTASIVPRVNTSVQSTTSAYATIYPGDIKFEQFIISADAGPSVIKSGEMSVNGSVCRTLGGIQCASISVSRNDNWLNEQGRYAGWSWSGGVTYDVPNNVPTGSKYCVSVGMTSADSHSRFGAGTVSGMSNPNPKWNVSVSCRTIAKMPNFQAWGANMYTQGDILTSVTRKNDEAQLGSRTDPNDIFGSWEEYAVISKSQISGFASGAAYGYDGTHLELPGGYHSTTTDFCEVSKLSISNTNCNSIGNARINISDALLNRLYARYAPYGDGYSANNSGHINNSSPASNYTTALGGPTMQYIRADGDATIDGTIIRGANSPGLVIYIDGTLTIDHNICYGAGTCASENNNLALSSRNSQFLSNISSLPQVIIIADNVKISENVSQIDAWLVAEGAIGSGAVDVPGVSRGGELGTIDTCYQFNGNTDVFGCNKTLIINGPVIAHRLVLHRTAGAYSRNDSVLDSASSYEDNTSHGANNNLANDGSITPAEIFNFRPDILLWSYQQSQNFSQATVTYTHELPPRY